MSGKKDVDAWDLEYAHLEWGGGSDAAWMKEKIPPGRLILDAGCGTGRFLKEFYASNPCIGLDFSKPAVVRSAEAIERLYNKLPESKKINAYLPEFVVGDITRLPFSGGFDAIICLGVLQHLEKAGREKAVSEFFRILQPNGYVFFEAFGVKDMKFGSEEPEPGPEPNTFVRKNGIMYHYFDESEVRDLFEKNGFQTIDIVSREKEKKYDGVVHIRHHIRGIFEKR
ncbi:hypothetical protein MsAg5_12380 [Methanosarcinaceae archaeon Ag5]|uniref:Methyltransferase type 11 domain-containing protein n=1 Tax=Methanolapillus africanus TaxID=3028297 RepID=A0AAE4SDC9_9EURY|nr:hypothetical protein [Methanosarcinaceae archaeon Ag5]